MRSIITKLWSNEFFKGGIFLTVSSFLVNILNYFFNFIVGRSLGPEGFGEIAALFSYVYILSVPISVLSLVIIQKISATSFDQLAYTLTLEDFFWGRLKKWWYFFIPLLLIIPFIPRITNLSEITSYVLIPYLLISFFGAFYSASLQGLRLFFFIFLTSIIAALLKLSGAFASLGSENGLLVIIMFLLLSMIISIFLTIYYIHKQVKTKKEITKGTINQRLISISTSRSVLITTFSVLAITAFNNVDIIFVKKFLDPAEAGIYSSWSLFSKIILYIVSPITAVSFIFFATKQTEKKQNVTLSISLLVLLVIGICSYIFYRFFGTFIIHIFFGNKFDAVIPYLAQAGIFGSLYSAITFINNYFLAKNSIYSLILAICIPFYVITLFLVDKNINNIITVNLIFGFLVTLSYVLIWFRSMYTNRNEKTL